MFRRASQRLLIEVSEMIEVYLKEFAQRNCAIVVSMKPLGLKQLVLSGSITNRL